MRKVNVRWHGRPVFIFSTDNGGAHTANLPLRGEHRILIAFKVLWMMIFTAIEPISSARFKFKEKTKKSIKRS
jgi:hypothetical protein